MERIDPPTSFVHLSLFIFENTKTGCLCGHLGNDAVIVAVTAADKHQKALFDLPRDFPLYCAGSVFDTLDQHSHFSSPFISSTTHCASTPSSLPTKPSFSPLVALIEI